MTKISHAEAIRLARANRSRIESQLHAEVERNAAMLTVEEENKMNEEMQDEMKKSLDSISDNVTELNMIVNNAMFELSEIDKKLNDALPLIELRLQAIEERIAELCAPSN